MRSFINIDTSTLPGLCKRRMIGNFDPNQYLQELKVLAASFRIYFELVQIPGQLDLPIIVIY